MKAVKDGAALLTAALERLHARHKALDATTRERPLVRLRGRSWTIAPGLRLRLCGDALGLHTAKLGLVLVHSSGTITVSQTNYYSTADAVAELLRGYLNNQPRRILRALRVTEQVCAWCDARIAGIERSRAHLLGQQAEAVDTLAAEAARIRLASLEVDT